MKCPNCAAPNLDSVKFCENCGYPLKAHHDRPAQPQHSTNEQTFYPNGQPYAPNGQPYYPNGQPYYPNGQPYYPNGQAYYPNGQPFYPMPADPYHGHSMKWYKFLIYFALIFSAVLCFALAVAQFTVGTYSVAKDKDKAKGSQGKNSGFSISVNISFSDTETRNDIYAKAPGLKAADIFNGAALAAAGVGYLAAWYFLFRRKRLGPLVLYAAYGFYAVVGIIHGIWTYIVGMDVLPPENTISVASLAAVSGIVLIITNAVYFNKRKDVFTE